MSAASSSSSSSSVHIATLGLVGGVRIRSVAHSRTGYPPPSSLFPLVPPRHSPNWRVFLLLLVLLVLFLGGVAAESNQFIRLIRRGQSIIMNRVRMRMHLVWGVGSWLRRLLRNVCGEATFGFS